MKKVLSCALSFLPIIMIVLSVIALIIITAVIGGEPTSVGVVVLQILVMLVEIAGFILGIVMMIMYIIKTIKNPNLTTGMKILWCALLFYLNILILPVYWFVNLRNE